ncbi:MAG: tetratricopeptide repeat protein [Oscillatoriales cyanobacterium SM2_2_1]|nr:tetratricopeptide repeat protein [Oscillatoriales cyanobacterium SM2_2_1]
MVTRIFLCSDQTEPEIRDFLREAIEDIANGNSYVVTWSCGSIQTVKVGDRAYFKRIGSDQQGYFASGRVVAADQEYQLRQKSSRYRELSEAYDIDSYSNNFCVWVAWDACVDFDLPLRSDTLRQLPQFAGLPLEPQSEAGVFREEYIQVLDREWDRHLVRTSKENRGIRLVDVFYNWGLEDSQQGFASDALDSFTKAIKIRPNFVKAYMGRGDVYLTQEQYQKAIADYSQVITLVPERAKLAYYKRGLAQTKLGQQETAIGDFLDCLALDNTYGDAYLTLGNTYYKLRDYAKAVATFTECLVRSPNPEQALYRRGRAHLALKSYESAIADFTAACESQVNHTDSLYYRGLAYAESNQPQRAIADLQLAADQYLEQGNTERYQRVKTFMETIPAPTLPTAPPLSNKELERIVVVAVPPVPLSEKTALVAITSQYILQGWQVRLVERSTHGYDLECLCGESREDVAIKEVHGSNGSILLSAAEIQAAQSNPHFILWVVDTSQEPPTLHRYAGSAIDERWELEPVEFRVRPTDPRPPQQISEQILEAP